MPPEIPISDEVVEALSNGEAIKLTHPDLGNPGYNGSLVLVSDPDPEAHLLDPRVEYR